MFVSSSTLHNLFSKRIRRNFAVAAALFAVCFLFNVSGVYAVTFIVNSTADANDINPGDGVCSSSAAAVVCNLRAAITETNALTSSDIITLPAGTYTQTLAGIDDVNATGDLDIRKLTGTLTINGAGSGTTIIQANAAAGVAVERVIHFPLANVTAIINNVTIRNGRQPTATFGGGVRVNAAGDNATFNNCVISNNFSGFGGGGIVINATTASVTLNNTTVSGNSAASTTAATQGLGGGIFLNGGGTLTATNSTISGNTASSSTSSALGGGIQNAAGTITLTNTVVSGNTVTTSVTANNSFGGGISVTGAGAATLTGSTVSGNTASSTGTGLGLAGGIYNEQATLNLTASSVNGNTASIHAGIRTIAAVVATTTITQSAVFNNTALAGEGGGVVNASVGAAAATTNINNSTVGGNMTIGSGGGVENFATAAGNATININYSTIAANAANTDNTGADVGGGIVNFVGSGAGVTTVNLTSSIVADNTIGTGGTGPDISGVITSGGYNHVENIAGGTFAVMVGDVTGTDPGLTALALNSGTTLNYLPGAGSPVLDTIPTGVNGCGTAPFNVDQRGALRPTDSDNNAVAACEKGSIEVAAPSAAATSVGGRVLMGSSLKRGLANATVTMTDGAGVLRSTRTNSFGYFQFTDVEAGQTYLFDVAAKRYQFQTQVININNDLTDLTFVPLNYLGLE